MSTRKNKIRKPVSCLKSIHTVIIGLSMTLASCNNPGKQPVADEEPASGQQEEAETSEAPDMHNAENSLDIAGVYQGTLPCADCEGIEVTLTLREDDTYEKEMTYLGKGDEATSSEEGNWSVSENTVTLDGVTDGPGAYFAGENTLTQLDMEGNRIEGELADMYVLKKQ